MSDEGAIEHIDDTFHYTKTPLDTAVGEFLTLCSWKSNFNRSTGLVKSAGGVGSITGLVNRTQRRQRLACFFGAVSRRR